MTSLRINTNIKEVLEFIKSNKLPDMTPEQVDALSSETKGISHITFYTIEDDKNNIQVTIN